VKRPSTLLFAAAAALIATSPVMAQPHDDHHDDHHSGPGGPGPVHSDWHKGGRIAPGDWGRGQPVDYRSHHLRRPPHGYEWRQVDGNYVLAAAATGLIAGLALAH
jgi:Ni/Co efflux regulator RcnB